MTSIQAHRGPDDAGLWDKHFPDGAYIGLGNRRLAILDLSPAGRMPLANEDGSVWITFNGEIYNCAALRAELQSKGHEFLSRTDTEVVVHLYEEYGWGCVNRLNGMFAFAICDLRRTRPTLFVARDHFGVKPFYYLFTERGFAFASEIKALLQVPGVLPEIDPSALQQYLTFLWVPDPKTMFRGIRKLPAGHYGVFSEGHLEVCQYWDLSFPERDFSFSQNEEHLSEEIRDRFVGSVKSQMLSDVPVGAFLSAGLDSSSIVAAMSQFSPQPVRTYTIAFPDKHRMGETTLDDPAVAARMAKFAGCEHHHIVVDANAAELLPKLTWHMDEPTADPALLTAFLVCKEARRSSTVLLSGVGGDELFAGYRKYAAHYWADSLQKIPAGLRGYLEKQAMGLPMLRGTRWKARVRLAKKMARSASLSPVDRFQMNCTYLSDTQLSFLCMPEIRAEFAGADPASEHRRAFASVECADFLNQMLYVDSKIFMTSLNLTYNDKMSMAASVEVRVPFLDRELAEFVAWNVPPSLKIRGRVRPTTKYLLRKAMKPFLPAEILQQPKAGFGAPVDHWLATDLREMVGDLLSESTVAARGLFRPSAVQLMRTEHAEGRFDWSMQIWQLLTLEIWMQTFMDSESSAVFTASKSLGSEAIA